MFRRFCFFLFFLGWVGDDARANSSTVLTDTPNTVVTRICVDGERISPEWQLALASRMSQQALDSVSQMRIQLSSNDTAWINLISSKTGSWAKLAGSLVQPFRNCPVPDTTVVFLGHSGKDDGFTYGYHTVCFDLKALQSNYGDASLPENNERIDRLFAHEFTHLLHKYWRKINEVKLTNFRDSVLWECLYEGLGMYRSLSDKWLLKNGNPTTISRNTLEQLTPVFVERLIEVKTTASPDESFKEHIVARLSRGAVNKKWGAFTVAIWLAQEAGGDDRRLAQWIEKGLTAPVLLAKKYLQDEDREKFNGVFK